MKLNASKTNSHNYRTTTIHSQSTPFTLDGTELKESTDLENIIEMTFDAKMAFEMNIRSVSSTAAQRLGIMKKS